MLYSWRMEHSRHGGHRGGGGHRRRDPRVARTRSVVLEAARKLLVEEGAETVTALRISEATGIARTTIYRHWPDREDLLRDTVALEEPEPPVALTGDTRTDLIVILTHMSDRIGRRRGARFMAVSIERSGLRGDVGSPHRDMVRRRLEPLQNVLENAVAAGNLDESLDVEAAVAQLAGPPFFRAVFMRQQFDPVFLADVVDAFLAAHQR